MKYLLLILSLISFKAQADVPATHGMVLFGSKTFYVSHLPMFHSPHDYQVLLEVSLKENRGFAIDTYLQDVAKGNLEYTLAPSKMDLTKVIDGSLKEFMAQLFKGHFEKGGQNLGWITVTVEKILYVQKLDEKAPIENKYLVFGKNGDYFAAHIIGGKPNYDLIASIAAPTEMTIAICTNRFCPTPLPKTIADDKLPITTESLNEQPQVGDVLVGAYNTSILQIIYSDTADLSH